MTNSKMVESDFHVSFMIIGAGKSGTSSLFSLLDQHPNLEGIKNKEPHFFSTHPDWKEGLNEYEELYEKREGALYFEGSTTYTFYPHRNLKIWDDIYEYNPNMKFIYMVRNPIDRFVSHYMHSYERGYIDDTLSGSLTNKEILDVTRYATQIQPYIERFGRENILLLDFDDFKKSPTSIVNQVCNFVGVDFKEIESLDTRPENMSLSESRRHHKYDHPPFYMKVLYRIAKPVWNKIVDNSSRSFTAKPSFTDKERTILLNLLRTDILALESLMGKKLDHWF